MLSGKKIALGLSGSIAAYKGAELARLLIKAGAEVQCIMTAGACEFISPLTMRTLTERPVMQSMFEEPKQWNVEHIAVSRWADLFLIAPATANVIGKITHGIADDLLTAAVMAATVPVVIAPALNTAMFENAAVQENLERLRSRGCYIAAPGAGQLACGDSGKGRLAELEHIIKISELAMQKDKPLKGQKVVITAGPTREPLDPVRYLTNHSSGKMGYALAEEAWLMGADVTLVSGPVALKPLPFYKTIQVTTAEEMAAAVLEEAESAQLVVKAAAVADYTPAETKTQKIKKQQEEFQILCRRTPDILASLGSRKRPEQVLVGFAAETEDLMTHAADKLQRKHADMIVANDVTLTGAGFGSDTNIVTLLFADGSRRPLPQMSKEAVAAEILQAAVQLLRQKLRNRIDIIEK